MDKTIFKLCEVIDITDVTDGGRIKVKMLPEDSKLISSDIPYAFPLLPKMMHIKPKIGEAVLVFRMNTDNGYNQRFYIGPIISQPQFIFNDSYNLGGQSLLNGSLNTPSKAPSINPNTNGAYPLEDDISLLGRGDGDIIIKDNEVQVRCGVKKTNNSKHDESTFNKKDSAFIQLKYDNSKVDTEKSTIGIVGDKIALLGNNSKTPFKTNVPHELINSDEWDKILSEAYSIPYGEKIVELMSLMINAFKTHTHPYSGLPPCEDVTYQNLDKFDLNSILSESIKIN